MTTTTLPRKSRMKVFNKGAMREINCFPVERDYMASFARDKRRGYKVYGDTKPTLQSIRQRAAERYL